MNRLLCLAIGLCFVLSFAMVGCATKSTSIGVSPETLGKIGAKINENPAKMGAILSRHNLTEKEFRRAIREVSADPALSRRYHEAFKAATSGS